jgi:alpha-tubulin suppressor-like RCC1 family protein
MMHTLTTKRTSAGFALPTVLIASVVMLVILIAAVGASSSIRTSLNLQYYNQLAREASESGVARAKECLEANGYVAQWNSASNRQLRPGTSCLGGPACTNLDSCFVLNSPNIRTTFSVILPEDLTVSQVLNVTSTVELLRSSNGSVWKTYTNHLRAQVGRSINFNNVSFGFQLQTGGGGANYATIGSDGLLRTAGSNIFGQLGNGSTASALVPNEVTLPSGIPKSIYTGFQAQGSNIFIITTNGIVYGMGEGAKGQLGNGTMSDSSLPVPFGTLGSPGREGISVTVNGKNTFVLTKMGTSYDIYAAGDCLWGNLGTTYEPTDEGCTHLSTPARVTLPTYTIADPNTHPTSDIAADSYTALVRMEGGRVYGWGLNHWDQLAKPHYPEAYPISFARTSTPIQVGTYGDIGQPKAVQIAFDGDTTYVVDDAGKIGAVGGNYYGQLGKGDQSPSSDFNEIPLAGKARKVTTDLSFASVLTCTNLVGNCVDGEVWSFGINDYGQLGNNIASPLEGELPVPPAPFDDTGRRFELNPVKFNLPGLVKAVDVFTTSIPQYNTFVIGDDGNVYGAGRNQYGQLGIGTAGPSVSTPAKMLGLPDGVRALQVKAGFGTTVVLASDGKIYTVGNNSDGQLGDGTTTNSYTLKANKYVNVLPVNYF